MQFKRVTGYVFYDVGGIYSCLKLQTDEITRLRHLASLHKMLSLCHLELQTSFYSLVLSIHMGSVAETYLVTSI